MFEKDKQLLIPLVKGHYGGPADTVGNLLNDNLIPLGFFYGEDVVIDDCGYVRCRPLLSYLVTYHNDTTNYSVAHFKIGSTFYTCPYNSTMTYCSNTTTPTWTGVTGATNTFTGNMNVDYVSASGGASAIAIVSSGTSDPKISAVSGTTCTILTPTNAAGLASQDENRVFCHNNGYVWFSERGSYTTGYASGDGGEWFLLGNSCDNVAFIANVAGALHVVKQSTEASRLYIFKKIQSYSDPEELLDFTSFQMTFGANDVYVPNAADGFTVLGGNIACWLKNAGLAIFMENGMKLVSEQITAHNATNLDYSCIVAKDEKAKLIFVKPVGTTKTYAYDYVKDTWSLWTINVTCKGFGHPGGMFGVYGTYSPVTVGKYPTTSSDTTVTPYFYTPVLNFDAPSKEKFLKAVYVEGRGVTQIDVYARLTPKDTFASIYSNASPERVNYTTQDDRFGECYIKITGNSSLLVKNLGVRFDVGNEIMEVS